MQQLLLPCLWDYHVTASFVCRGRRGNGYRSGGGEGKKKIKQSWEDEFWNTYEPPKYVRNRYFWIATSIVTVCLIVYSVSQKAGHG